MVETYFWMAQTSSIFTARCTIVQSAVLWSHVVCLSDRLSVTLVDHDHIGWKSWKLIARTISPTSSLFVAQRSSTYSQGNMEKLWGENVRSTPTSTTSGWIESTECHVILGGGVAVCLLLSAHRAVIFAIAQLSCRCSRELFHQLPDQTDRFRDLYSSVRNNTTAEGQLN